MKLTLPLALAPALVNGWAFDMMPYGSRGLLMSPRQIMRQQQAMLDRIDRAMTAPSSSARAPRYEVTDTEEKFELALAVPGYEMNDITVNVEGDGEILTLTGHREQQDENYSFTSKFSQSFSLDPSVDVDKFTATLKNGVLVVGAPKNLEQVRETVRRIPIMGAADAKDDETASETLDEKNEVKSKDHVIDIHDGAKEDATA